jgi:hypothetical protein
MRSNKSREVVCQTLYCWHAALWYDNVDILATIIWSTPASAQIPPVMDGRIEVAGNRYALSIKTAAVWPRVGPQ